MLGNSNLSIHRKRRGTQKIEFLETTILNLVHVLDSEGKSAAIKSAITSSQLPKEIKEKLLMKGSVSEK
jgi:hypothetical protein